MQMLTTQQILQWATESLLSTADLSEKQLAGVLGRAMTPKMDYADLYLQNSCHESWTLEEGIIKTSDFGLDRGFGLRVICGEKTGFAYADDIQLSALNQAASSAQSIVQGSGRSLVQVAKQAAVPALYPAINPLTSWSDSAKVALLQRVDQHARRLDPRIQQVNLQLFGRFDVVMILNSEGELVADVRPLVGLTIRVIAVAGDRREQGFAGGGARTGYDFFIDGADPLQYAERAVKQAITSLAAVPAPAGAMPVVLGPGWPAVLFHEAVGHGLEADFNRKQSSVFSGRLGEKVASACCTLVDDGTIPQARGSIAIDDEGCPGQKTVLIENGVLKSYLQDRHNAKLMQQPVTGNGRRESYAHLPLPRMTNTCLLAGDSDPADIIASVDKGLYAVDFSGGQVDTTSGNFVFSASEAYLIEKGRITRPVKGATLIGSGIEALQQISMVGHDLRLDGGLGTCGKAGQSVPVGVGQPTLKIDCLTVGGSQINV